MEQQPSWSDYRTRLDFDDLRSERSTSAPPPESSAFEFGRPHSKGPSYLQSHGADFESLFEEKSPSPSHSNNNNNNGRRAGNNGSLGGLFLGDADSKQGRYSVPAPMRSSAGSRDEKHSVAPPGFQAGFLNNGPRNNNHKNFEGSSATNMDRAFIGENLMRSQSAAPSLDSGFGGDSYKKVGGSSGPPGFAGRAALETPLASNRSEQQQRRGDSYLSESLERGGTESLLHLAERRPASTGVIGQTSTTSSSVLNSLGLLGPASSSDSNGSGGGAVRPAAKTLMDLIQEDVPPDNFNEGEYNPFDRGAVYVERPRTTSPLSLATRDNLYERDDFYPRDETRGGGGGPVQSSRNSNRDSSGYDQFQQRSGGILRQSDDDLRGQIDQRSPTNAAPSPQYITLDRIGVPQGGRSDGSIYAPAHSQPQYSAQNVPYGQPSFGNGQHSHIQAQTLNHQMPPTQHVQMHTLPNGQTVYVSTAPPPPYGYPPVQYQPHSQQHQQYIIHQPGMHSNNHQQHQQQYVSVMPNHGGQQHMHHQVQGVGPGGSYTYVQQAPPQTFTDNQGQTFTIVSSQGPQVMTLPLAGGQELGSAPQQHSSPPHGGRGRGGGGGRDRSGRGGRGGQAGSRRVDPKHAQQPPSSPLLEDFKAKKNQNWTTFDIKDHVVEFCQDQNGSRFIQQRLEIGDSSEKELVMQELLPAVRRLRNDVFGNYVVQKLLDFGTPTMKSELKETMMGEMLPLSLQMYGCRVVQKALETLDDKDLPSLLEEFRHNVIDCIQDQNGNHVIQKCIEVLSKKTKKAQDKGDMHTAAALLTELNFIVDDILSNVTSLSCHPYGCRVFQRILEHCPEPKKSIALDEIKLSHRTLLDDQYGNYVIQHVLQYGRDSDRDSILAIVVENGLLALARQKFASNVVEKLLKYGNANHRKAVVREMLKIVDERSGSIVPQGCDGTSVVLLMVRDAYANYVVQTSLDVVPESQEKKGLLAELNSHSDELKNYTFAKHIVAKLGA